MKISLRNKLLAVCFSTTVFTILAAVIPVLLNISIERHIGVSLVIGFSISLFEEFYVQGKLGRWFRIVPPIFSILIYGIIIIIFSLSTMAIAHAPMGLFFVSDQTGLQHHTMFSMLAVTPVLFVVSAFAIMTIRIVGYIGAKNLVNLMIGKYYRPQMEQKIFMFLDLKNSTELVERLGPIKARALISKFFFDISAPITDHAGEIYRFTGDGVVACWDWNVGIEKNRMVRTIDAIGQAVMSEANYYQTKFDYIPEYRIGVHGGPIVTSEEGDTKRAIGFYGETIHVAARLEEKAKELNVNYVLSEIVAKRQSEIDYRLRHIGKEAIRGITAPINIYELVGG
jgi:adenylate cyclase